MININEFRDFVLFVMNKSGNGEQPSPDEFNSVVNQSLTEWLTKKIGNPAEYQPQRPIPPQAIDITQRLIDDLRELKVSRTFNIANNSEAIAGNRGRVILPDGTNLIQADGSPTPAYLYFLRLENEFTQSASDPTDIDTREVNMKTSNQITKIRTSTIVPPTTKFPVGEFMDTYIQVYPTSIQTVILTYLRQPNVAKWDFTLVNNRPVYNSATSIDIDIPYLNKMDFSMIYLKYQGIHLNDTQLTSFANQMETTGV